MGQAYWLRNHLGSEHRRVSVIILQVNELKIQERAAKRNNETNREDDTPEVLADRLDKYKKYGPEMRRFLTHNYTYLTQIDGNRSWESVSRDVLRFVDSELEAIRAHKAHEQHVHRPSVLTAF
jgi:adenylate kinase family enzyme